MSDSDYDLIVIGGGAVGENIADHAVRGGLRTLLVESELLGGECSYWACMPSKALLRSGHALRAARRLAGTSAAVTGDLDVEAVLQRRDRFANDWDDSRQVDWALGAGIELLRGEGRLTGVRTVEVIEPSGESRTLTAAHAVAIATGSDPLLPDIPGLAQSRPWTPREATSADRAPASLLIIGGGVVGTELACAYASFGTEVTLLARSGLLGGMEPFAGELVEEGLREAGVTILRTEPTAISRDGDEVIVELKDGDPVRAEEFLVATGRVPRTRDIGLASVGGKPGDWLTVDDTMLVDGYDWLYAAGDVNHRALLTHQGKYQARAAGDAIAARAAGTALDDADWGRHVATADHVAVPQVVFTDPEVATVGLTAAAAEAAGRNVRIVDYDLGRVGGAALQADGYRGAARLVVDEDRGVVAGATFVGQDVAELLHAATVAIVGEVPMDRLWHAVASFPTMSEVWLRLLQTYRGGTVR